jgi:capsular exopolysaccharide synthesis family protein
MVAPDPKRPDVNGVPPAPANAHARSAHSSHNAVQGKGPVAAPLNALAILKALRRRWLAAALLGVLAAGAAFAGVWYFLPPPQYCAAVKFRIPSKPDSTLYEHPEAKTEFSTFEDTQVATIKSQNVLNAALDQPIRGSEALAHFQKIGRLPDLRRAPDQTAWLEKEIHIDYPNGKEILRLSIYADDADTAKVLVSAVSAAYLQEISNQTTRQRQKRIDELQTVTSQYEEKLKKLRQAVHERAKMVGGGGDMALALKQLEAHEQSMAARHQLVDVETRLRTLETDEKLIKDGDTEAIQISARELDDFVDKRPEVAGLLAQKAHLESQIALTIPNAVGGEKHPEVVKMKADVAALAKDLDARRQNLRADCERLLREQASAAAKARVVQLHNDIEQAKALRAALISDIEAYEKEAQEFNNAAVDLDDLKPEIAQVETVATRAAQEMEKLTIEQLDPLRVTPWEDVTVTRPDELDRKVKMAALSAGCAFLLALLLVGFLEFRARRIYAPDEVVQGLGMKLVGTVPARPSFQPRRQDSVWHTLLAESVDASRTMLLHGQGSHAMRVVMITSAVGGEGKTSLASHLAVSLARSGRKTLLIDGDLRSPAIHKLFNVRPGPGLSELLRGDVHLFEALCPAAVACLHVLTAGNCDAATLSRLSQDGMGEIVAKLKESYDFIIVDSSPVLPVTDSLLLARHVDGVLFSVLQDVSTLPAVHEAYQRLAALGVPLLGAVVSGTRPDVSRYGRRRAYPLNSISK